MVLKDVTEQSSIQHNHPKGMSAAHGDGMPEGKRRRERVKDNEISDEDRDKKRRSSRRKRILDDDSDADEEEFNTDDAGLTDEKGKRSNSDSLGKPFDSGDDNGAVSTTKSERSSRLRSTSPKSGPRSSNTTSSPPPVAPSKWTKVPSRPSARPISSSRPPKAKHQDNPPNGEEFMIKKKTKKPAAGSSSLLDNLSAPPPDLPAVKTQPPAAVAPRPWASRPPPPTTQQQQPKKPTAAPQPPRPEAPRSIEQNLAALQQQQKASRGSALMNRLQKVCTKFMDDYSIPPKKGIDLFGSFLDPEQAHDFFDHNKDGHIVIPAPIPVFPEDFRSGEQEHDLAWWGIVDRKKAAGKYGSGPPSNRKPPPTSNQDKRGSKSSSLNGGGRDRDHYLDNRR